MRLLRGVLAVLLLGLLLWLVEWRAVLGILGRAQPGWLLLAAGLLVAQTAVSALRWRLVAARLGQRIAMGHALREYFLAQAGNMALPGGVAGDAARAVRARAEVGLERAGMAVVLERAAGQVALVVVTVGAVLAVTLVPGGMAVPGAVIWALLLAVGGVGLTLVGLLRIAGQRAAVARWHQGLRVALLAREVRGLQAGLSLGTVALNLLAFWACAASVGVWLTLGAALVVLPLVLFAMLVPLTVGGWGLREGAAVALFPLAGASGAEGFAASAAFGAVFTLTALVGLILMLRPVRVA